MYAHFPVHRLPGGQPQAWLERDARLAPAEALAEHEFWRDRLPGVAGTRGQPADDASGGGRATLFWVREQGAEAMAAPKVTQS